MRVSPDTMRTVLTPGLLYIFREELGRLSQSDWMSVMVLLEDDRYEAVFSTILHLIIQRLERERK